MSVELDATVAAPATLTDDTRTAAGTTGPGLRIGTMLAHFRIDGLLGKGGMGEVYRATDLALDRPVALKVLPATVAQDPTRRERLFREARAQARLQHPNVCHIYYVGQQDGIVFFAMELVGGESLAERLARGPVGPDEAVELIRQAALGLREAHWHGFTHRDIKPSNLMCDREGRVKVVDFGLVTRGGLEDRAIAGAGAAETGAVGTPLYMAPEQAAGDTTDLRADIYALGATLHHLISGRPPFAGESLDELATQHRSEPRPRLIAPGVRPRVLSALDGVIARMMAKQPGERFASYDELIADLDRVSAARTRPAGLFPRSVAAVIDILVVAFTLVPAQFVFQLFGELVEENVWMALVGAFYGIIALSRWGTTLGHWMLDLEVVALPSRDRPSLGAAAIRHLTLYGFISLSMLLGTLRDYVASDAVGVAMFVTGAIGFAWPFIDLASKSLLRPDKRTLWDEAARTMVRYRTRSLAS